MTRSHPSSGFTLLEIVVALAILAATVALGLELSRSVSRTGMGILRLQGDWSAEQFLRGQLADVDAEATLRTGYFRTEPGRIVFVTKRSAQFGPGGPSFVVSYRIGAENEISYFETMLPPQWTNDPRHRPHLDRLLSTAGDRTWSAKFMTGVSSAGFRYLSPDRTRWIDRWPDQRSFPAAVRLTAAMPTGPLDLVIETRDSYFSLFSGS